MYMFLCIMNENLTEKNFQTEIDSNNNRVY